MRDTNVSATGAMLTPIAPIEHAADLKTCQAKDPKLHSTAPPSEHAISRIGTASSSALTSLLGDGYALIKNLRGTKPPQAFDRIYTALRTLPKTADLPLRITVYAYSIGDAKAKPADKAALLIRIGSSSVDLATEYGLLIADKFNKKYTQLEHVLLPSPRPPADDGIPMRELPPRQPSPKQATPHEPFVRADVSRAPLKPPRTQPPVRNSAYRNPVKPSQKPLASSPGQPHSSGTRPPSTAVAETVAPHPTTTSSMPPVAKVTATLNHIGNVAGAVSSMVDIYFGVNNLANEPDPVGKTQGAFLTLSGAGGLGATTLGSASLLGIGGPAAATTATGLTVVSAAAGLTALGMAAIPVIHGHDNKHRAYKLHNDLMYDVRQLELADKQLTQRTGPHIRSDLERLNQRYGVQPKTVWLNNNGADLMNEINSPNNTSSGQWKPDAHGKIWSDFRGEYIRIGGTPHQATTDLDLASEHDGTRSVPAPRTTVTIAGDEQPDKKPRQVQTQASDPSLYTAQGWRHSKQQPWLHKDYGYQTSNWGSLWETSIPATVSAGPLYVAHDAVPHGKDRVVLVEDTHLASTLPLPKDHYTEDALFALDGHDAQRLTARQVAALQLKGTPAMVPAAVSDHVTLDGMKFNVSASSEKPLEDTYREAVYPMSDKPHVRSPDVFERTIATDPSVRTVVSLPYVRQPVKIIARHPHDVIDLPSMPEANVEITLPRVDPALDKRQLGLYEGVRLSPGTPNNTPTQVFHFPNGKTLTVHAENGSQLRKFWPGMT
jgi:hypothetical protein